MNKGRFVLGISLIVLAGTIFLVSHLANFRVTFFQEEDDNRVNTTVQTQLVENIRSLKTEGVVTVYISTGDTEKVRYVYDTKRYKNKSSYNNGVLKIDFSSKGSWAKLFGSSSTSIKAFVTVKKLEHIEMDGVGSVRSKNKLKADDIEIINDGTGSMKLEIDAKNIKGRNDGVGSMKIKGSANTAKLHNSGVGSVNAGNLIVQVLSARNEGVGSMEVYAEKEITLRNSGVGSIRYSGNAEVKSVRSDGIGSVSKK